MKIGLNCIVPGVIRMNLGFEFDFILLFFNLELPFLISIYRLPFRLRSSNHLSAVPLRGRREGIKNGCISISDGRGV
jgi:hypothetical protein